jgi:hypothetical protein
MRRVSTFLMFLMIGSVLAPALAWAQVPVVSEPTSTARVTGATTGSGRGLGVGAVALFAPGATGTGGAVPNILATWGAPSGKFHLDGLFGLTSSGTTSFDLGARGWYHIHAAPGADLSVGGGFALLSYKAGSRKYDFELELGAQIRAFIVSNVALLGSVGMAIYMPDSGSTTVAMGGSIVGSLGVAYFFQ